MCGIFAFLGCESPNVFWPIMVEGLESLKSRGYDSCGMAFHVSAGDHPLVECRKFTSVSGSADAIDQLAQEVLRLRTADLASHPQEVSCGIAHTRWATHGRATNANAHPHCDGQRRFFLVHNGVVENYAEVKQELSEKGYSFVSDTDTEVVAVLAGYYLDEGHDPTTAIEKTLGRLRGTWAFVFMHRDHPHKLWLSRNGSPLLIGYGDGDASVMISSQSAAFGRLVQKYVSLDNHDIVVVEKNPIIKITSRTREFHSYPMRERVLPPLISEVFKNDLFVSSTSTATHYMIREILEQPAAIEAAMNHGGRISSKHTVILGGLQAEKDRLLAARHLVLLGCGSSYHAAKWAETMFRGLHVFDSVQAFDAGDFVAKHHLNVAHKESTVVLFVSQSGETRDVLKCLLEIQEQQDKEEEECDHEENRIFLGVTNGVDSMLAQETHCGVYIHAGEERSVAATKSFTNQCIVLALIAVWFSQHRDTHATKRERILSDLQKLSWQLTNNVFCEPNLRAIEAVATQVLHDATSPPHTNSLFVIGKSPASQAVAQEAALKFKETCYVHAEAFSTASLKHGPLSLITTGTPVILLDMGHDFISSNEICRQEVVSRGAQVLRVTNRDTGSTTTASHSGGHPSLPVLPVLPGNSSFESILANAQLQLLAYYLACAKGINPDYPRNLAKSITV